MAGTTEEVRAKEKNFYETIDSYLSDLKHDKGAVLFMPVEAGADKAKSYYLKQKTAELGYDFRTADASKQVYFGEQILPEDVKDLTIERPPKLLGLNVQHGKNSVLMSSYRPVDLESKLDPEIQASMTIAVTNFIKDNIGQMGRAQSNYTEIAEGDTRVMVHLGPSYVLTAWYEAPGESQILKTDVENLLKTIEKEKGKELANWNDSPDPEVPLIAYLNGKLKGFAADKKYSGEVNPERVIYERAKRTDKTWEKLEKQAEETPIVLFMENLEQLDETDTSALDYITKNVEEYPILIVGTRDADKPHDKKVLRDAAKALEIGEDEIKSETPEHYRNLAQVIESKYKDKAKQFSPLLAELYLKAGDKENVVKWAKVAAEQAEYDVKKDQAIYFYRMLADNSSDKNKLDSLEKVIEQSWVSGKKLQDVVLPDAELLEKLALESGNYEMQYKAALWKAKVFNSVGKIGQALIEIKNAEELLQKLGREEDYDLELVRSMAHDKAGDKIKRLNDNKVTKEAKDCYGQALLGYQKAEQIAEKSNNKIGKVKAIINEGRILQRTKEYNKSIEFYNQALEAIEPLNDNSLKAMTLNSKAIALHYLNKFSEARLCAKQAVEICEKNGIVSLLPPIYNTASLIANRMGRLRKGLEYGEKARKWALITGKVSSEGYARGNMGEYHLRSYVKIQPEKKEAVQKIADVLETVIKE